MERIWRNAPIAALRVWYGEASPRWEANPVALEWAARRQVGAAAWAELVADAAVRDSARYEADLHPLAHRIAVTRVALADGLLLWLEPMPELAGEAAGARLDLLEEVGRMGVAVRDLATGRGHWDAQVFRLFGIDPQQATPSFEEALSHVHADDLAATRAHLDTVIREPRRDELRYRIVRPDGVVRHVHSIHEVRQQPGGGPGLLVDVMIDDTESVEKIAAQRRIAEFLDRALVLAEISVWRVDLTTNLVHFNSVGIRLTDVEPNEAGVPVESLRNIVHPDDLDGVLRAADEAIATGKVVDVVSRYRNRQGGWSTLLTRRVADRDREGHALALAGISIDLTQQIAERERAAALRLEKRRAEQARRDQSAFLSRMSHELRTPMNAVLGFARLMAEDTQEPLSSQQRLRLEHIREAGQQLLSLTDGLLEMTARDYALHAAREAEGSEPAPLQDDAAGLERKRLTLVCVEDNPVNMLLVRELLALRPEVELHCAVDGLSGVDLALRVRPRVMLLDLQLPDIGGDEVMHRVRGQLGEGSCIYIALSANAMPEHIRDMLDQGFDQYWTKPIDFSKFLGGIDTLIQTGGAQVSG